jgi:hypothetical protein
MIKDKHVRAVGGRAVAAEDVTHFRSSACSHQSPVRDQVLIHGWDEAASIVQKDGRDTHLVASGPSGQGDRRKEPLEIPPERRARSWMAILQLRRGTLTNTKELDWVLGCTGSDSAEYSLRTALFGRHAKGPEAELVEVRDA